MAECDRFHKLWARLLEPGVWLTNQELDFMSLHMGECDCPEHQLKTLWGGKENPQREIFRKLQHERFLREIN